MLWNKVRLAIGVTALCATACGGGGSSAGATDTNNAAGRGAAADGKIGNSDPDAKVSDLNSAEWKAACVDIGNDLQDRDLSRGFAVLSGLLAKAIGFDCMSTYQMFLDTPPDETQCDAKPTDCSATLRELDECNVTELVWLSEQTKGLDCSSSPEALGKIDQSYLTPECQRVKNKCPSFKSVTDQGSSDTSFDSDAGF